MKLAKADPWRMSLKQLSYIGAIQLNLFPPVVLVAGVTPEALHLCLVDGRGVVHLHSAGGI